MSHFDELDRMQRMFKQPDAMDNFRKQIDSIASVQKSFDATTLEAISGAQKRFDAVALDSIAQKHLDAISEAQRLEAAAIGAQVQVGLGRADEALAQFRQAVDMPSVLGLSSYTVLEEFKDKLRRDADVWKLQESMLGSSVQDMMGSLQSLAEGLQHKDAWAQSIQAAAFYSAESYETLAGWKEQLRQNEETRNLQEAILRTSVKDIMEPLQSLSWVQKLADATQSVAAQYDLAKNFGVESLAIDFQRNAVWSQSIQAAASPVLSMFSSELLNSIVGNKLAPSLVEGFGAQLLGYISEASEADTEEEFKHAFQDFLAWFVEQIKLLPRTLLSANGMFNIFMLFISLFQNQWLSAGTDRHMDRVARESEQKIEARLQRIEEAEEDVLNKFDESRVKRSSLNTCVVMEAAQLREGPGKEFESIRVLPANLLVETTEMKDGWAHIKFFDYTKGQEARGWVSVTLIRSVGNPS